MIAIALLAAATLASEDLTCISAGLLIRRGEIHWSAAIAGCFLGIYLGDLGLWMTGRLLGRQLMKLNWLTKRIPPKRLSSLGNWFDRHAAASIFAARFLPGTRLPMYLASGALGRKSWRFAAWTFLAAAIWTPILVLLSASLGDPFARSFERFLGMKWLSLLIALLTLLLLLRIALRMFTWRGRAQLIATISRFWRWEFWPMWLFYLPLLPWIALLALRHRSLTVITAANPGIPHGGFVGESKFDILRSIKSDHVSPTILIPPGDANQRVQALTTRDFTFPIILKPDVGQRGSGVKLIQNMEQAIAYLADHPKAVLAQPWHPGPYEAGIFYYRFPNKDRGHIFSITDKQFPTIIGDGISTIEQLIWRHPRLRLQARLFLNRHASDAERILPAGQTMQLSNVGNHCQGTLFRDGAHLLTPQLESAIDRVARTFDGFHFGRFDVRYRNVEAFRAGEDFTILELNGITSESTNLYDPAWSLLNAYRTLFRQWRILFHIGVMNRRRAERSIPLQHTSEQFACNH